MQSLRWTSTLHATRAARGGNRWAPLQTRRLNLAVPFGVIVALAGLLAARPSTPAPAGTETATEAQSASSSRLRSIVIDPGHGGLATGAIGAAGLSEKELTLDIAERLRTIILRRLGLQVSLTRDADIDMNLDRRTETANNLEADLFISIHANGYRMRSVRGPETYFLSASASNSAAQAAAARENGDVAAATPATSTPRPPDPALEFILWDLAQTQHLRESSLLAEGIQSSLNGLWSLRDRGVKQAPFRVLKGASMPAILVEVGYLSNPDDAALLSDPSFRQQIAEALFRGIAQFRDRYDQLAGPPPNP